MGVRDAIAKAITAFHSSPFDLKGGKFDWRSARRTGEGNATFGEGTYAAESPLVSGRGGHYWQQNLGRFEGPERGAAEELRAKGFDRVKAVEYSKWNADDLQKYVNELEATGQSPAVIKRQQDLLDRRLAEQRFLLSPNPVGPRTYELAIHARPEEFLDWYKPMNQQEHILNPVLEAHYPSRDALLKAGQNVDRLAERSLDNPGDTVLAEEFARAYREPNAKMGDMLARMQETKSRFGGRSAADLQTGAKFYSVLDPANKVAATEKLVGAGVPGIRYTDASSRIGNPSNPTYNYVVGDDLNRIEILKKYAVPGAVAAPVLGAAYDQSKYEVQP